MWSFRNAKKVNIFNIVEFFECERCAGKGRLSCPTCGGNGKEVSACRTCEGSGKQHLLIYATTRSMTMLTWRKISLVSLSTDDSPRTTAFFLELQTLFSWFSQKNTKLPTSTKPPIETLGLLSEINLLAVFLQRLYSSRIFQSRSQFEIFASFLISFQSNFQQSPAEVGLSKIPIYLNGISICF